MPLMWNAIVKKNKSDKKVYIKKKLPNIGKKKENNVPEQNYKIYTPEEYFDIKYSEHFEKFYNAMIDIFESNIDNILNKNTIRKEYEFFKLIKQNVNIKNNQNYIKYLKLFEDDEEYDSAIEIYNDKK